MNNKQVFNLRNVYFGAKITTIIRALFVKKGKSKNSKRKENCAIHGLPATLRGHKSMLNR
jgi:hypothetical protein